MFVNPQLVRKRRKILSPANSKGWELCFVLRPFPKPPLFQACRHVAQLQNWKDLNEKSFSNTRRRGVVWFLPINPISRISSELLSHFP
jgi:hypothetical protein